ncbi:MAG TPA: S8 family serine peptidase [Alphaproteobacteria bacterium]|nr:S8 family serine peptidase [Alphaproteobacteria bacterium]
MIDRLDAAAYRRKDLFSGYVILRLKPEVARRTRDLSAANNELKALVSVLDEFGVKERVPVISADRRDQVLEWERRAEKSSFPPLRSLTAYWRLDLAEQRERMPDVVGRLRRIPEVDEAYVDVAVVPAAVQPGNDPLFSSGQRYLQPAPVGIDALWAWSQPSGDGSAVAVADLEAGWNPSHEDVTGQAITIIGDNHVPQTLTWPLVIADPAFADWNHGTAVLGILAARDNAIGGVGIAPNVKHVYACSVWQAASGTPGHVVDALTAAMQALSPGDIILLELQTANGGGTGYPNNHPIEIKSPERDAIRLAVANNFVVVAAAGNGAVDLDQYTATNSAGQPTRPLNRNDPTFEDSGAIMVGAATSGTPHQWASPSNFGSRLDCYAWNDSIGTCGFGIGTGFGSPVNQWYQMGFGATSGASAIVAGAAVLLQSMHVAAKGTHITPAMMRTLLGDPNSNTKPAAGPKNIGVMPNLRALSIALGLAPDVYLRDAVGDAGTVPSAGAVSLSPDIIVQPAKVVNPDGLWGETSGNENRGDLTGALAAGKDAFVYLRMRNRGSVDAHNVVGHVWWSEPGTNLTNPALWHYIGQTAAVTVPAGNVLTVAGPVDWPAAQIPPIGHYCLVAMADCPRDPAPDLGAAIANFESLVRDANNITWRNINVVSSVSPRWLSDAFFIAGMYREARRFDFEIVHDLPAGTLVSLEMPIELAEQMRNANHMDIAVDESAGLARVAFRAEAAILLRDVGLPANARYAARFLVISEGVLADGQLAIRQLCDGLELGRMTWRFTNVDSAARSGAVADRVSESASM